jgi:hypothetical protein
MGKQLRNLPSFSDSFRRPFRTDGPSRRQKENANLALYTAAMKDIAAKNKVVFLDVYSPSKQWFDTAKNPLTIDGSQLTEEGYAKFSKILADGVFGKQPAAAEANRSLVHAAVMEKNWMWHNDIKIPNGVHVYGRRYNPFGQDNYPGELTKIRQMTAIRDTAIWKAAKGETMDLAAADKNTIQLAEVKSNYDPEKNGSLKYLYGEEALNSLKVAPGYKIELFASEKSSKNWLIRASFPSTTKAGYGLPPCQLTRTINRGITSPTTKSSYWKIPTQMVKPIKKPSLPTAYTCRWVSSLP